MPASAPGLEKLFEVRTWEALSDRGVSRMGRALMKAGGDSWTHGESAHFICHTQSEAALGEAMRKAEFAMAHVQAALRLPKTERKTHFFVVADEATWQKAQQRRGWRADGLALQCKNEFAVLQTGEDAALRDEIPHEITHILLRNAYALNLPVALEEGLGMYLGWEANVAYHERKRVRVQRTLPEVHPQALIPLTTLEAMNDYPSEPASVEAFYRQSEIWARGIAQLTGKRRLGDFVRELGWSGRPWRDVLRTDFGCTEERLLELRDRVQGGDLNTEL